MCLFAIGIEHPLDVTVQRPHDADPGQHRGTAGLCNEDERLHGGLPFGRGVLRLRQLHDVVGSVPQGEEQAITGSGIGSSNGVDQGNCCSK
jgi:hypothetical protein